MTKLFNLLITLLFACSASLAGGEALRVVIDNKLTDPVPPYRWYDHCEDHIDGFNYHLFKRLASDLNMQLQLVEADFAPSSFEMLMQAAALLKKDKADFALGIPTLLKDDNKIAFNTVRVMKFKPVLLLRSGVHDISDLRTLESMKGVVVTTERVTGQLIDQGYNLSTTMLPTQEDAALALADSSGDYWVTERYVAQHMVRSLNLESKVKFSDLEVGNAGEIYIMARNNEKNTQTLGKIDRLISSYHKNGFITHIKYNIMKKWLKENNAQCNK